MSYRRVGANLSKKLYKPQKNKLFENKISLNLLFHDQIFLKYFKKSHDSKIKSMHFMCQISFHFLTNLNLQ